MKSSDRTGRNSIYILLAFSVFAFTFYSPLHGVGFVTDFLGWVDCSSRTPFLELYSCFGTGGLYFIPYTVLTILSETVEFEPSLWYFTFTGIHAVNAWLIAILARQLLDLYNLDRLRYSPVLAGFLFLIHPYNVEVVAWKACINYLTSLMFLLSTLILFLRHYRTGSPKFLVFSLVLFGLSLFNIEFNFVAPLVILAFLSFKPASGRKVQWWVPGLYFLLVAVILVVNNLFLGDIVGHYGVESLSPDPLAMFSNLTKYGVKIGLLFRFWPYNSQDAIYTILGYSFTSITLLAIVIWMIFAVWRGRNALSPQWRLLLFLTFAMFVMLLPVSHLFFYYLQLSENDRYSYLALPFFAVALPVVLGNFKYYGRYILGVYTIFCIVFTFQMCKHWQRANEVYVHMVNSYRWQDRSDVLVLNLPDNYRGIYMFRNIGGTSALREPLELLGQRSAGNMRDVIHYNMRRSLDGVSVEQLEKRRYKVAFKQWGNWWWQGWLEGPEHSSAPFKLDVSDRFYILELTDPEYDPTLIYYDGLQWREFH